ncbi:MAG: hypothetical protein IJ188_10850 [Clostridia bacterium]|nr:hypothetical protein [Clostridia bacterium]
MKKLWKGLLALALVLILLGGDLGMVWGRAESAQELAPQGVSLRQGADGSAAERLKEAALSAKNNKKKKNTPTPRVTASPTPKATATPKPTKTPKPTATPAPAGPTATPEPEGPIIEPQSIADYLFSHDMQLPENFITKKQAQALGWDSSYNYVSDVAPGKSIGGDYFGNYEGKLPQGKGITYHEADCYYTKGKRNAYRVIFSTEGRVWYTEDHYNTFTELFPFTEGK